MGDVLVSMTGSFSYSQYTLIRVTVTTVLASTTNIRRISGMFLYLFAFGGKTI